MRLKPTKNDLAESVRSKVVALLISRLADCIDLRTQTKQATGTSRDRSLSRSTSSSMRSMTKVEEYVDTIAERGVPHRRRGLPML